MPPHRPIIQTHRQVNERRNGRACTHSRKHTFIETYTENTKEKIRGNEEGGGKREREVNPSFNHSCILCSNQNHSSSCKRVYISMSIVCYDSTYVYRFALYYLRCIEKTLQYLNYYSETLYKSIRKRTEYTKFVCVHYAFIILIFIT